MYTAVLLFNTDKRTLYSVGLELTCGPQTPYTVSLVQTMVFRVTRRVGTLQHP
jgi:hypothetical protein